MLILAGPGSGKTFTITEKVVKLIENGLKPERILALTFSDKAAGEMGERIERTIGPGSGIDVSTFHSFCNNIIREFSFDMGINSGAKLISKEHSSVWGIMHIDTFGFENIIFPSSPYDLIDSLLEDISQFQDHLVLPSLQLYLEGLGFRSIGRYLGVSHVSVQKWIKTFGQELEDLKSENEIEIVELDEMHTYINQKKLLVDLDCC